MVDITRDSALDLNQVGTRTRILTGIEATEIDNTNMSELIRMVWGWKI